MARKTFLRQGYWRYSKLGLRRKNKLIYRKAKGRDNKVRLQEKGRIVKVKVGFKKNKNVQGLVKGLKPVLVHSINDIKKLAKQEIGILARIGNKKKKEIATFVLANKITLINFNAKKFMKNVEFAQKNKMMEKSEKEKKLKEKEDAIKKKEDEEKKAKEKESEEKKNEKEKPDEKVEENKADDNKTTIKPTEDKK
ncbi:hypothetical protein J4456_01930 [Candidatus Pacearchaeota archaeon]|nr:hypothetical protein [Candidatus Pacearchaeota archaeon]